MQHINNTDNDCVLTHLPIYKIQSSNILMMNDDDLERYSIPKIFYDSISSSINCVLLGESTHGTKEFYELRSIITKQLILNKHFNAIFIEMDWPKTYILNEYVTGKINCDINKIFDEIKEYPLWMYRNYIFKELIFWLRNLNKKLKNNAKNMINVYGIDMQSYYSLDKLILIYKKHKFLPNSSQILSSLNSINFNFKTSSLNTLNNTYNLFLSKKNDIMQHNKYNKDIMDLIYNIDQNFVTLQSALNYFGTGCKWNIRDNHWLNSIEKYFNYNNGKRIILWAHNSHICNADYINYTHSNIGSFLIQKYGKNKIFSVCFDSFKGSVTATNNWNERPKFFYLKENVNESYGRLWHDISANIIKHNEIMVYLENGMNKLNNLQIDFKKYSIKATYFVNVKDIEKKIKIRDIGVCYENQNPYSHCSDGNILKVADIIIFIDNSSALQPFYQDKHNSWDKNKLIWQKAHMHSNF